MNLSSSLKNICWRIILKICKKLWHFLTLCKSKNEILKNGFFVLSRLTFTYFCPWPFIPQLAHQSIMRNLFIFIIINQFIFSTINWFIFPITNWFIFRSNWISQLKTKSSLILCCKRQHCKKYEQLKLMKNLYSTLMLTRLKNWNTTFKQF